MEGERQPINYIVFSGNRIPNPHPELEAAQLREVLVQLIRDLEGCSYAQVGEDLVFTPVAGNKG